LFDKTGTNNIFDSVIVITDRTVLDKQLSDEIKQFSPTIGIVAAITSDGASKTNNLREAIANKKESNYLHHPNLSAFAERNGRLRQFEVCHYHRRSPQ
jgi:hypothetical protein